MTSNASIYASNFLHSGSNPTQYMSKLASKLNGINASLVNPIYQTTDFNGNHVFQFDIANSSGQYGGTLTMPVNMQNGNCVLVGDQLPFSINVSSTFYYHARVTSTGSLDTTTYPAVSTPLTAGIVINAGSDGFNNSTFPDTYNGTTVDQVAFDFCDQNMCNSSNNTISIFTMYKGSNNSGYYYTPNNTNTIPLKSYASLGITTPLQFYNGNPYPIRVRMYSCPSSGCQLLNTTFISINGEYITQSDLTNVHLPAITNIGSILGTATGTTSNQVFTFNTPAGVIIQTATMSVVNASVNNGIVAGTSDYVLGSPSSITINQEINANGTADSYRGIKLTGSTSTGLQFQVKYVYSTSPYST